MSVLLPNVTTNNHYPLHDGQARNGGTTTFSQQRRNSRFILRVEEEEGAQDDKITTTMTVIMTAREDVEGRRVAFSADEHFYVILYRPVEISNGLSRCMSTRMSYRGSLRYCTALLRMRWPNTATACPPQDTPLSSNRTRSLKHLQCPQCHCSVSFAFNPQQCCNSSLGIVIANTRCTLTTKTFIFTCVSCSLLANHSYIR